MHSAIAGAAVLSLAALLTPARVTSPLGRSPKPQPPGGLLAPKMWQDRTGQFALELQHLNLQVDQEGRHIRPGALARSRLFGCLQKIGEAHNRRPQSAGAFHLRGAEVLRHPPTMRPISSSRSAAKA